ncbi:MAG: hypothetical protein Q8L40_07925 [Burkholderiales bacterium]|nr:hypothetical protein [Burkholderiales bacterium]
MNDMKRFKRTVRVMQVCASFYRSMMGDVFAKPRSVTCCKLAGLAPRKQAAIQTPGVRLTG